MHWFGVPGIANGLAVMRDEETLSLWDHMSGECFDGPLKGKRLAFWPVSMTSVAAELERDADAIVLKSKNRSLKARFMATVGPRLFDVRSNATMLAPHFRKSMATEIDDRRPEGEQGLGLMSDDFEGKFYPMDLLRQGPIVDEWRGRPVRIALGEVDKMPEAIFTDTQERPMQLLTRWYGFAFTCPECEIYSP